MNASTEELYTVVENLAAGERVFGFLGPRGMRLGPGEVVALPGDLTASLGSMVHRGGRRRSFDALERAVEAGLLRINSKPAPVVWDPTANVPRSIGVDNGVLGVVDPDYSSSIAF